MLTPINSELPEPIVKAFYRILDNLSDQNIVELSKVESKFLRGHRNIRSNVAVVRNQLKVALKKDGYLSPPVNLFLMAHGLYKDLVIVFSEEVLDECFENLAIYFGEADFLAAMLLDKRSFVRDLAMKHIGDWDENDFDESFHKSSGVWLQDKLKPFLSLISTLVGREFNAITKVIESSSSKAKLDKINQKLKAFEKTHVQFEKRANRDNKDHQAELASKLKEISRLQGVLKISKERISELDAQLVASTQGLVNSQVNEKSRVQAEVDVEISSTLRQWLLPALVLDEVVKNDSTNDILARSKAVLKEQQAVDRKYGNIVLIEEMIEVRRKALDEIVNAKRSALNPIPGLTSVAADLEKEINNLEIKINRTRRLPDSVNNLLGKINSAVSIEELSAVRQFIQQSSIFEIINSLDLTALYREADVKAGLIYDQCLVSGRPVISTSVKPFFSLFYAMAHGTEFFLMIDGHNVLFELDEIFGGFYENGHPASKARSELELKLKNIFTKDGADVILYYDSPTPSEVNVSDHLRVKYSGGEGDHRADNAILRDISFYRQLNADSIYCLVTKDRGLALQAMEMGSFVIDPEEFSLIFR